MSAEDARDDATVVRSDRAKQAPAGRLSGHMGVFGVLASVLAASAPVALVVGFMPFIIAYAGAAAPMDMLVVMVLALLFSVGFTAMSRYLPNPGAFYSYVTAGFGKAAGLGAAFLATYGYVSVGFATLPFFGISVDSLMTSVFGMPHVAWYWYGLIAWAAAGVFACLNIDLSAKVLGVTMGLEVLIVLVFDGSVMLHGGGPQGISLQSFTWGSFSSGNVGLGLLFGVLCVYGFESTVVYREEVKSPRTTISRATYLAVIFVCLFLVLASWMLVSAYGAGNAQKVANDNLTGMFTSAMATYVDKTASDIVLILLVTSIFAAVISVQNISSRYLYSLGFDGALPRFLGRTHPKHGSPFNAAVTVSVVWGALGALFAILGVDPSLLYGRMSGLASLTAIILYLIVSVTIIFYFRKSAHIRDATVWQRVIAPLLSTAGFGAVTYLGMTNLDVLIGGPKALSIGLVVMLVAIFAAGVLLAIYFRRKKPMIYAAIGRQDAS